MIFCINYCSNGKHLIKYNLQENLKFLRIVNILKINDTKQKTKKKAI